MDYEFIKNDKKKKRIGILTSGGDSPGMNAAVRSIVRVAIARGCEPYAIFEGYQGLVQGGDKIKKFGWGDVRGYLAIGGTLIKTARCKEFQERDGRLKAAYNLIKNEIDSLIVCGGDGSLTGADIFRSEWPGLIEELVKLGRVTKEEAASHNNLTIVGMVGSIDNDMSSTDLTIGAVTSLHRICEAVDCIASTAYSHSRAFIIEVMGRNCGWLALMAAISTNSDFVFIPESPPSSDNWEEEMCQVIKNHRNLGKFRTIVIVGEGAIDKNLQPIKADYIKDLLKNNMGLDTRVTTLGHIQRGGRPCVFDRNLATLQGYEAVKAILNATPDSESPMIGIKKNKITCEPLMKAVKLTHQIAKAVEKKDFKQAMELRDSEFIDAFDVYKAVIFTDGYASKLEESKRLRIGIIHVGAPASGMNAATAAAVRYALNRGHIPVAIFNSFKGLLEDNLREFSWIDVDGWTPKGGSELGTNRSEPDTDIGMVAFQFQKHRIDALLLIGGFEAYSSLIKLNNARNIYPAFCIPMICLPATISNNVPGTDYSLGSDTSLNTIVDCCDTIKQSASASRRRVFVVELHGGYCGYLTVLAGLATLQSDVDHLNRRFSEDKKGAGSGRLILRNECVSTTYTTNVIADIIQTEAHGLFDSRTSILGHIQQGATPSPLDRIRAIKLAVMCVKFLENHAFSSTSTVTATSKKLLSPSSHLLPPQTSIAKPRVYTNVKESAAVIGIDGEHVVYRPVIDLLPETDMDRRKSTKAWWIQIKGLVDLLSKWGYSDKKEEVDQLFHDVNDIFMQE
ncbi:13726_t:CDS:10 [Entrophospora sp. SA101]|nr:13726_t:CDS:10 [Entrophospora sp. SA101]CAJ0841190.1 4630_t:CDS:10 [Entrophospora sp. SA101]CAJ0910689.1 12746_t:CDS:10 [Entrophospora sp. SA101]